MINVQTLGLRFVLMALCLSSVGSRHLILTLPLTSVVVSFSDKMVIIPLTRDAVGRNKLIPEEFFEY